MNDAGALLGAILKKPDEFTPWLMVADWLQEQDDPEGHARAELLRLRVQWAQATNARNKKKAETRAKTLIKQRPALIGALEPLLAEKFQVLAAPSALAIFLLADYAPVEPQPLAAGTVWEGALRQSQYSFPTILRLRTRTGNKFEGDMTEDFSSMYRAKVDGTFHFRGVIAGAHIAFVTWKLEGAAAGPGLYQFRVSKQKRWTGTWAVGAGTWNGTMWLKPQQGKDEPHDKSKKSAR